MVRQLSCFIVLVCVHRDNLDWSSAPAIQEMPVVSAICEPTQQQVCLSPYPTLELRAASCCRIGIEQDVPVLVGQVQTELVGEM